MFAVSVSFSLLKPATPTAPTTSPFTRIGMPPRSAMISAVTNAVRPWLMLSSISAVGRCSRAQDAVGVTRGDHRDHQHHGDAPTNSKANCRVHGINFYEAVVARQAAATCGQGTERQRILDALVSEINVFNGLIAAQCAS